jgi:hypothetical protein
MISGDIDHPVYLHKSRQGGVFTKTARKVCSQCNRGWMRDIELAAENAGTRLINGQAIDLKQPEQEALASFIFQSALMIDLLGKDKNKFPKAAYDYFYENQKPPRHWYVGIGYYEGLIGVRANYSPQAAVAGGRVIAHSISTILGHLFTSVQTLSSFDHAGNFSEPPPSESLGRWPLSVNAPHLTPIAPYLTETIRFPQRPFLTITGGFVPNGGLARDLSLRFGRAVMNSVGATHPGGVTPT